MRLTTEILAAATAAVFASTVDSEAGHHLFARSPIPRRGEKIVQPIPATEFAPGHGEPWQMANPPNGVIPWGRAWRYVGQHVTIEGRVVHTTAFEQAHFLNFARDWRGLFYVVILDETTPLTERRPYQKPGARTPVQNKQREDLEKIPVALLYLDRTLRVTGRVTLRDNRPQIVVTDISQITVMEPP